MKFIHRNGFKKLSLSIVIMIPFYIYASSTGVQDINNIIIPKEFGLALQEGMSVPLFLHYIDAQDLVSDQLIGHALIWMKNGQLKIQSIQLEHNDDNAVLQHDIASQLAALANQDFDNQLNIPISSGSRIHFALQELRLQLIVPKEALGTTLRSRSEDIGASSVDHLSNSLTYNLGIYNNQMKYGGNTTSSYLSFNNVSALREHHVIVDGSFYGLGSSQESSTLYKAMYEKDFDGHRFAGGMLDTWNLQSLGPMTAISSGKIYGFSWGNEASSTVFDNSQSLTPVIAFLPAAGEVHVKRDGRLLSVQNFTMGNHEIDTKGLPYGTYDVDIETIVNGRVVGKRVQRVNKLFSPGHGSGAPMAWQFWGGKMRMDRWFSSRERYLPEKETWLMGASISNSWNLLSWAATAYGYDQSTVAEARFTFPVSQYVSINMQDMAANDGSWSNIDSISATIPGGFSSVWVNQEKTQIGEKIRRTSAYNQAIGGTLNLGALWSKLGTLSISYNNDKMNSSRYYTGEYYQTLFSGAYGTLGMRAGIQRYNNGERSDNTGKYISLDFSLPFGNWLSMGMSHQNGYTLANLSARKQFAEGSIRSVGANLSRAVSGNTGDDQSLSGGGYAQFDTRYSSGAININSSADGYVNTNLTANGSVGWQGTNIAASGRNDGSAGVILNTNVDDGGKLSAKVNGRTVQLDGKHNFIPLSPYSRYQIDLQNSTDSIDSYAIVNSRKTNLTLYPGNIAVINPEVKRMVTVFGRIHAEDGSIIANAHINNHIGRTRTDDKGGFIMDVDKKYPLIDFNYSHNQQCEVELDISNARGAIWVGDVVCHGLKSYAGIMNEENGYEG
ncbi:TPA: hypothetical protein I9Y23_004719 [Kluyvera ascorbata]|uniref:Fimbrial biogenesis outer membrane usher protein n=2 Tax=Kluyvera genomosp. 2 TaxID=2774054 RepID=A0A2T2XVQ1_9ENTR|nr:hypothetical protein C8256_24115 [Kluyvera genomosp. 2]HAT3921001.1 hypothetical protein [Kluyvera ascorbata]HAT3945931.1 hypothetical protein [Kluyvera ascorbata]HAT3950997.1 hypothetical protein [Kluyvera ascorbata]